MPSSTALVALSVFNPQFAVFEFGFSRRTTLITATPPRVWRSALEVFFVVVRVGIFQLATDLTNPLLHVSFGFTSGNDRGGFFVNRDLTSDSHHIEETASRLSPTSSKLTDHQSERRCLAAWLCGDRQIQALRTLQYPRFIHDQSCQRFSINIFSNYQQRLTGRATFQDGNQILDGADFLVGEQDPGFSNSTTIRSLSVMK